MAKIVLPIHWDTNCFLAFIWHSIPIMDGCLFTHKRLGVAGFLKNLKISQNFHNFWKAQVAYENLL